MNMVNEYSWLKVVAQAGDINLLYTLIKQYPNVLQDIDSIQFVETPLHFAACEGHLEFATEVMRLKPSFAWKLNPQGFSPIHLAMQNNQKSMVIRFLEVDSNLARVKGRGGLTPLHLASQIGDVDLLADLLYACPDSIEDVTARSETALHIAIKNQKYESLQVLIGMLKRNHEIDSREMANMILNWKDENGNTILHISARDDDSQAIGLLVKTKKIHVNAKNLESKTALDIATNPRIRAILSKAEKEHSRWAITNAPTFADELRSKTTFVDEIRLHILRIRNVNSLSEEQRNACLIIAVLVATVTYQAALSPPGGVFQANVGDNSHDNTTSSNSSATSHEAGTSVLPSHLFWIFYLLNTFTFMTSIIITSTLTPSGIWLLGYVPNCLVFCYFAGVYVISPAATSIIIVVFLPYSYFYLDRVVFMTLSIVSDSRLLARSREIYRKNSARVNRW